MTKHLINHDCLFCKIIAGESPSYKVYENKYSLAVLDIFPVSPGHILVMPKEHFITLDEMDELLAGEIFRTVWKVHRVLQRLTPNNNGFNILQNNGKGAGQEIGHVHFHIIPRFSNDHVKFRLPKITVSEQQLRFIQNKLFQELSDTL